MITGDLPIALRAKIAAWWDTSALWTVQFDVSAGGAYYYYLRSRYGGAWSSYNRLTYGTYYVGKPYKTAGGLLAVGGVAAANPKLQSTNASNFSMGTDPRTQIFRFRQESPGYVASFGKYEIDKYEGVKTTDGTLVIDRMDAGSNIETGAACGNGAHTVAILYASGTYEIRLDGVTVAVESRTSVAPGLTKIGFLGACDQTSVHAAGKAGEMILWNRKLSPGEIIMAEKYLAGKWRFT